MKQKVQTYRPPIALDKVDKITLIISFVFLLSGLVGQGFLSTIQSTKQVGEKIAYTGKTENTVKRKALSSLLWLESRNKEELFYGDEIMTGENSHIEVIFLDQSKLEIPEKSLVRLTKTSEGVEINLLKGAIKFFPTEKPKQNFKIKQNNQVKSLININQPLISTLPIQIERASTQVVMIDKTETVAEFEKLSENLWRDNETIQLKRGQKLSLIEQQSSEKFTVEIQLPDKKILVLTPEMDKSIPVIVEGEYRYRVRTQEINSEWDQWRRLDVEILDQIIIPEKIQKQVIMNHSAHTALLKADTIEHYDDLEFIVYKKNDLSTPYQILKYKPEGQSLKLDEAGEFLWQVRSTSTLEVSALAEIIVQTTILNNDRIIKKELEYSEIKNQTIPIELHFSKSAQQQKGIIEVFHADDLSKPIVSQHIALDAKITELKFDHGAGRYLWKIKPLSNEGFLIETPIHQLNILDRPPAPLRPSLPDKLILNYQNISGIDSYRIEIPKQKNAKSYYLEVYRDSELKQLVYKQQQAEPLFIWRTTRSGHYYYRFLYTDQWDRKSPFTIRGDLYFPISPFEDF